VRQAATAASRTERGDFSFGESFARHHDHHRADRLIGAIREQRPRGVNRPPAWLAPVAASQGAFLDFRRTGGRTCLPEKRVEPREIARLQVHGANERKRRRLVDRRAAARSGEGNRYPACHKGNDGERQQPPPDPNHAPDHVRAAL
jgi:hypothetical protein